MLVQYWLEPVDYDQVRRFNAPILGPFDSPKKAMQALAIKRAAQPQLFARAFRPRMTKADVPPPPRTKDNVEAWRELAESTFWNHCTHGPRYNPRTM